MAITHPAQLGKPSPLEELVLVVGLKVLVELLEEGL